MPFNILGGASLGPFADDRQNLWAVEFCPSARRRHQRVPERRPVKPGIFRGPLGIGLSFGFLKLYGQSLELQLL